MKPTLLRRVVAEFTGTLLLLAAVVGSEIMGERLAAGNVALALLANTLATGAALIAIILAFGPISGAHLNPAVTLADAWLLEAEERDTGSLDAPRANVNDFLGDDFPEIHRIAEFIGFISVRI